MTGKVLVEARDVSRTYGAGANAVVAVHGVTFLVHAGEHIALIGPSGSGKTTLLHLFAGLDEPTTGSVDWPGIGSKADLRPGPVAVVFQAPSLLPPLDVIENVALPLVLGGYDDETARLRALQALAKLGLEHLAHKLPEELSGGQSQLVAIARALSGQPQLILADEPTGQLDRINGSLVTRSLIGAANETGAALVISTHDNFVADHVDIKQEMQAGRLLLSPLQLGES